MAKYTLTLVAFMVALALPESSVHAYMSPCEALGVGCAGASSSSASSSTSSSAASTTPPVQQQIAQPVPQNTSGGSRRMPRAIDDTLNRGAQEALTPPSFIQTTTVPVVPTPIPTITEDTTPRATSPIIRFTSVAPVIPQAQAATSPTSPPSALHHAAPSVRLPQSGPSVGMALLCSGAVGLFCLVIKKSYS